MFWASGTLHWLVACVVVLFIATYAALQEIFKPVHRRVAADGSPWHLPPGPSGLPIVGTLLQMMAARRDTATFSSWVSPNIL